MEPDIAFRFHFYSVIDFAPVPFRLPFHTFALRSIPFSNCSRFATCAEGHPLDMTYTAYIQRRILYYHSKGYTPRRISIPLKEDGMGASYSGIASFLAHFHKYGSTSRCPGSGRLSLITDVVKRVVDQQMEMDDKTTVVQLEALLAQRRHTISLSTILHCRKSLGWTFRGSAFCQMVHEVNKANRLDWA